jgi:hypothetical protein
MPGGPSKRRRSERRSRAELAKIRGLLDPDGLARRSTLNLVCDELSWRKTVLDTWASLSQQKHIHLLAEIHRCHSLRSESLNAPCRCAFCEEHELLEARATHQLSRPPSPRDSLEGPIETPSNYLSDHSL